MTVVQTKVCINLNEFTMVNVNKYRYFLTTYSVMKAFEHAED